MRRWGLLLRRNETHEVCVLNNYTAMPQKIKGHHLAFQIPSVLFCGPTPFDVFSTD